MNILFVCTGNTCRSPMAEGYLNHKGTHTAKSAGLFAGGEKISQNSADVLGELNINISSHISCPITKELIDWADKIYCMGDSHRQALKSIGISEEKLFILGNGIPDPFGQDISVYRECRDDIIREIDKIFPNITVRRADMKSDAQKVHQLEELCFSSPWSAKALIDSQQNGTVFFVAEINQKIAGYIGIDTVLDEGYITNIAVFPEFRKMGVGSKLMSETKNFATNNGLSFLSLEVRESNLGAQSLYKKFGFEVEGKRKNFYKDPTEDALIFTKRF